MAEMGRQECLFEEFSEAGLGQRKPHVREGRMFRNAPGSSLQPQVLAPTVEEMILEDDPVRPFKVMMHALDVTAVLDTYFPFGGVGYHPRILLSICLFGALDGIHTGRELESHCRYDLRYRYLTDGQIPDHSTISRFRNRLLSISDESFAETIKLSRSLGLGSSGTATVDGRKTAGALDQWVRLRKGSAAEELNEVSDPEARTLRCTRTGYVNGYSCMAAVDSRDDIILGACPTAESSDNVSLGPLLDAMELQGGKLPHTLVMDGGFSGSDSTGQLAERGVEAFISPSVEPFWELDDDGEVICPAGHRLVKAESRNPKPIGKETYRIRQCKKCVLKELCGVKNWKTLQIQQGRDPRDWVKTMARSRTPDGRKLLAYRKGSIERLFAQIFYHRKFTHFTMRGLSGAKVQLMILCMAHNLGVLASMMLQLLGPQPVSLLVKFLRAISKLVRSAIFWLAGCTGPTLARAAL
jgi:transposase